MHIDHRTGSILDSPITFPIAHAISQCATMRRGLARKIDDKYKIRSEIRSLPRSCPDVIPIVRANRLILNAITKQYVTDKPLPHDVYTALTLIRQFLLRNNLHLCAFPRFSAGLDLLPFHFVYYYIQQVFRDYPITIIIYHLPLVPRPLKMQIPSPPAKY